jgi:hypothetical protein
LIDGIVNLDLLSLFPQKDSKILKESRDEEALQDQQWRRKNGREELAAKRKKTNLNRLTRESAR